MLRGGGRWPGGDCVGDGGGDKGGGAAASSAPDHDVSMGTRTDGRSHEVDAQ